MEYLGVSNLWMQNYFILSHTDWNVDISNFWPCRPTPMIILSPYLILLLRLLALRGSLAVGARYRHPILSQILEMASSSLLNCTQLFPIKSPTSDKSCSSSVQCFLDTSPQWKNTHMPSGYVQVSSRIAGFCNTFEPGRLAILVDNVKFLRSLIGKLLNLKMISPSLGVFCRRYPSPVGRIYICFLSTSEVYSLAFKQALSFSIRDICVFRSRYSNVGKKSERSMR